MDKFVARTKILTEELKEFKKETPLVERMTGQDRTGQDAPFTDCPYIHHAVPIIRFAKLLK